MQITFPHMGDMAVAVKALFQELGFSVVVPPPISRKTLNLGVKYSPEFACLPFKINLGNFMEALDKGADLIVMGGGCGPCRFGYYAEVQREILQEMGYEFSMYVIEPGIINNIRKIRETFGPLPFRKVVSAVRLAWNKARAIDDIYKLVLEKRALEVEEGLVDKLYAGFIRKIDETMSLDEVRRLRREYREKIEDTSAKYKRGIPLKVGLVGEIYLVLEPFVNLEIEKRLGQLGVMVERDLYMTNWLLNFLHLRNDEKHIRRAARKYLGSFVGGHGIDSVGNTVRYSRRGFDGVIQLGPFTCMPEIIARSILPAVSKGEGIPVLTFFFDEHSADAGIQTRLEAFVDLLERKKRQRMKGLEYKGEIVYGQ